MAKFNWLQFCTRYSIEFVEKGPNVSKSNINIECPFCGNDPSHHLGLSLKKGFWGCWRNKKHRGKKPHKLIMSLLHVPFEQAVAIVGTGGRPNLSEFDQAIANLKGNGDGPSVALTVLQMPKEFKPISRDGHGKKYWGYLTNRGFKKADISKLCDLYDLRYCQNGKWGHRIIIPVYMDNRLVCWTSRTISKRESLRYVSLTTNPIKAKERGDPVSPMNIKDTVLWYDDIKGLRGDTFVLCEGPFDALKVDYYGRKNGVRSTCIFSTDMRDSQMLLIDEMAHKFRRKLVLLDQGQTSTAMGLVNDLVHLGFEFGNLPQGVGDPGDMTQKQIEQL